MASRRLLLGAAAVAAVASLAAHATSASFSAGTSNSANTFSAASSWGGCPNTTPTTDWIGGFELGKVFTGHATGIALGANAGGISAGGAFARNGSYGMRVNATGSATYAQRLYNTSANASVMRFAINLQSLPATDVELAKIGPSSSGQLIFRYHAAANRFAVQFTGGTAAESSMTVTAGQWYVVDLRTDMASTTSWTGDWRVNGVAQTSRTLAATQAGFFYAMWLGTTLSGHSFVAFYDDIAMTRNAADYPLGDGKVLALRPAGMGTSVGAANFQHDDGTPIDANTYQRLDEIPMSGSTDYVQQVTTSPGSYVELRLQQTSETCIRMVEGLQMNNMGDSNQNNHGKASLFDGAAERIIYEGGMIGQSNNVEYVKAAGLLPGGARWTQTALNNAVIRIGYSNDASPIPRWDALLVEYEVAL